MGEVGCKEDKMPEGVIKKIGGIPGRGKEDKMRGVAKKIEGGMLEFFAH